MQNNAEDTRPWAIMIIILPEIPHVVADDIPAIMNLMWDTEE